MMRYFFAAYNYSSRLNRGSGNLWFSKESYPSMSFLKSAAAGDGTKFKSNDVVVTNIIEMSEVDFNDFCGDNEISEAGL